MTWLSVTVYISISSKTHHRIFDKSNRIGATRGEGTVFASGAPALIPAFFIVPFCGVRVAHCLDIYVVFFRSLSFCPFSFAH